MSNPLDSITTKQMAALAEALKARGIPEPRAEAKAEGTVVGRLAFKAGIALTFACLLLMVALDLNVVSGLLIGAVLAVGVALAGLGVSLISRDAAPIVAKMGEWLVSLVRAVRGAKSDEA